MARKKTYRGLITLKADSDKTGEFTAEFATLGVKDKDNDVALPGAFQAGQETLIEAWNHNYSELPVGKGAIREEGNKAVFGGAFFMDTDGGLEHYKVVKALGGLQEWSYTFEVLESSEGVFEEETVTFLKRLDVWGVAPVERGAGIDTRTVMIKAGAKVGARHTAKEYEAIQKIHDLTIELGAKCAEPEGDSAGEGEGEGQDEAGDGKSRSRQPSTFAERVAIEMIEEGVNAD